MTELNETCSCGAEFHWVDGTFYTLSARTAVQEWRDHHHHEMPAPTPPSPSWSDPLPGEEGS